MPNEMPRGQARAGLALTLIGCVCAANAEQPPAAPLTVDDAMSAMTGMAGTFRRTPDGEVIFYPSVHVDEKDQDTHPGALVAPVGMSGMQSSTGQMEGMSSLGGQRGYFRVSPQGQVYFYPYPGDPVGMSGMSGASGD